MARALLVMEEVVLIPMGPPQHVFYVAMDARALQSQFLLRMKAVTVDLTDANVADYETQDGLFISATIPVQNLDKLRDARTAFQRMLTQNNFGSVQEVPAARAFVVTDFAPVVATIYRAIRRLDAVPAGRTPKTEFFDLRHANAKNVARILDELFGERGKPAAAGSAESAGILRPSDVRVSADPDTYQVVVIATEETILAMRPIVARLDRDRSSSELQPAGR